MAFMVPLVKNHYDIYARNNPADHVDGGATAPVNNSLYLSATSLGKNGAKPLTKQYRIVISGGKVVGGAKQAANKKQPSANKPSLAQAPGGGKLYYRMPSASISLPVVPRKPVNQNQKVAQQKSEPSSPQSVSPPSRPLPHVRRTVRNPMTNRVYSYSVSIPDYVAEEDEEEDEEDEEDDLDDLDIDLGNDDDDETEEDKENLLLFSTSAPAGTGPIAQAQTPSPPPIQPKKKNAKKLQQTLSTPNSPDHQGQIISSGRQPHSRTLSSTSTTSTTTTTSSNTTNSREYVELLRKFILHLKMLKIGGGNKKRRSAKNNNNPSDDLITQSNAQQLRPRKRKDTMEDSNHL